MTPATERALMALNNEFYRLSAADFDRTRQAPWGGWRDVVEAVATTPRTVLDAGCGNGRFGVFLATVRGGGFSYCGVDASDELLSCARPRLESIDDVELVRADILTDAPESWTTSRPYALVVAFGVLHHVPSRARRGALVQTLASVVEPGGHLALSMWRFDRVPSIVDRAVAPDAIQERTGHAIDPGELEPGDYILPWGASGEAFRYCHAFGDVEVQELIERSGLELVIDRCADGRNGELNRYVVLRRQTATVATRVADSRQDNHVAPTRKTRQ